MVGPQLLALTADVVADHLVGSAQDVAGRAVVLLKPDGFGVFELLFKLKDVGNRRAAELVDGLVVVTDHADVLEMPRQQTGQHILGIVGVLIFVYQHIAELVLIELEHVRVVLQQQHGFHDNVVKVERASLAHLLFVPLVHVRNLFAEVIPCSVGGELLRGHQLVFRARDHADDRARIEGFRLKVQLLEHVCDHTLFVILVVDGKRRIEAQQIVIPPQDAQASGVERVRPNVAGRLLVR